MSHDPALAFKHALTVRNVVGRFVQAMVFPNEGALKRYLEDHPEADPANHSAKKLDTRAPFKKIDLNERAKWAMEFPTEEARKKYLQAHPGANPSNHSVATPGAAKPKGEAKDSKPSGATAEAAHAEAAKSTERSKENDATYDTLKSLKKKVDDADSSATKKFNRAYDKLFDSTEKAVKSAEKLLHKCEGLIDEDAKTEGGKQQHAAMELLHHTIKQWSSYRTDHLTSKGGMGLKMMSQAEQTHGYAQDLEKKIRAISGVLKDPENYTLER